MNGKFFDTNVLIYSVSADARKADRATVLLEAGGMTSVQALNEAANVLTRKSRRSWAETHDFLNYTRRLLSIVPVTDATHEIGLKIAGDHRLSIWDSMILAAALQSGCDTLWSEDMRDDVVIAGAVRVVNPFL